MPQVFRRTPETEEASRYGYRDFLKDVVEKTVRDTKEGLKKPLKFSESDLLDMATAGGGMLKVAGTGKLLAGILKAQKTEASKIMQGSVMGDDLATATKYAGEYLGRQRQALKEAMRVPQKEWKTLRDIKWSRMRGRQLGTHGEFDPHDDIIRLLRSGPTKGTVFHEFGHKRQFLPEEGSRMPTGIKERHAARALLDMDSFLRSAWLEKGGDIDSFYHSTASVMEEHARVFERKVGSVMNYLSEHPEQAKHFKGWDRLYKETLEEQLESGEKMMRSAYHPAYLRKIWYNNLAR